MRYLPITKSTILIRRLFNIDLDHRGPAFIASLPYVSLLRLVVYFGVLVRFFINAQYLSQYILIAILFIDIVPLTLATHDLISTISKHTGQRFGSVFRMYSDVIFIFIFYSLSGTIQSDLFLCYSRPILAAAHSSRARDLVLIGTLIILSFASVVMLIPPFTSQHISTSS